MLIWLFLDLKSCSGIHVRTPKKHEMLRGTKAKEVTVSTGGRVGLLLGTHFRFRGRDSCVGQIYWHLERL